MPENGVLDTLGAVSSYSGLTVCARQVFSFSRISMEEFSCFIWSLVFVGERK